MNTENLHLHDNQGFHSEIADFLVGEPIDDDGLKYQELKLTTPMARAIQPGSQLVVIDSAKDSVVVQFVAESVSMQFSGEQFFIIEGKNYIKFPSDA